MGCLAYNLLTNSFLSGPLRHNSEQFHYLWCYYGARWADLIVAMTQRSFWRRPGLDEVLRHPALSDAPEATDQRLEMFFAEVRRCFGDYDRMQRQMRRHGGRSARPRSASGAERDAHAHAIIARGSSHSLSDLPAELEHSRSASTVPPRRPQDSGGIARALDDADAARIRRELRDPAGLWTAYPATLEAYVAEIEEANDYRLLGYSHSICVRQLRGTLLAAHRLRTMPMRVISRLHFVQEDSGDDPDEMLIQLQSPRFNIPLSTRSQELFDDVAITTTADVDFE